MRIQKSDYLSIYLATYNSIKEGLKKGGIKCCGGNWGQGEGGLVETLCEGRERRGLNGQIEIFLTAL